MVPSEYVPDAENGWVFGKPEMCCIEKVEGVIANEVKVILLTSSAVFPTIAPFVASMITVPALTELA
ncbi:hypothetical protein LPTSP2_01420 [Leptospira ellinghausenii]|uniref:Uncharacterized protein n=1 Tax=Leptospira ellinghausenii TaxID=1917822 RepID=A0A2P2D8B9_9LEPT|nr:hypothetical protein LPTSP2_01420 [Leptospira ellinghausenii]